MSGDIRRGPSARRAVLAAGIGAACLGILASGTAGARVGVGGVWLIDEGRGQTVRDSSGNANHGVLGSTTSVDTNDPRGSQAPPGGPRPCASTGTTKSR